MKTPSSRLGSIGNGALSGIEVKLGENNELLVRPTVMRGYYNKPGSPPR